MSTVKKSSAILTGIFVFLAIIILVSGIFAIGSKDKSFSKSVLIKAFFDDVNGLANGNNVWYAGLKIGIVKSMAFKGNGVEVQFTITETAQSHIYTNTKVKLGTDGLIGDKIIVLYGGSADAPLVAEGTRLQVEKPLNSEAIMRTLQANNENLLLITQAFKSISKGLVEGNGTIGKLLTDITLASNLQATMHKLNKASTNAEVLTVNLSRFTGRLVKRGTLVDNLLTDTTIFAALQETSAQLSKASDITNEVVANLAATTKRLTTTDGTVGLLLNDTETAKSVKTTLYNLEAGTRKMDENMEALQHNFLLRSFFKKKSKIKNKNASPAGVVIVE
jgi:phospholipid/cholesterol/gamma-HCH transport system substrate-binding protein